MKYPTNFEVASPVSNSRAFLVPIPKKKYKTFCVIASEEKNGWNHVSVSLNNRTPTWEEMCHIKDIFFNEEDFCLQFHPKKSQYVNAHKHCLHIWQPPKHVEKILEKYE